ncbi:hypothetical protein RB594_006524 [Gaeumannomyces avenae]
MGDKQRLYLAVYPSGIQDDPELWFAYGFLIGPKKEYGSPVPGYVVEPGQTKIGNTVIPIWRYGTVETQDVSARPYLLARILIAKITDFSRLTTLLRTVQLVQGGSPATMSMIWARQALNAIKHDGRCVGTSVLDWARVDESARKYADVKGQLFPKPTYCLITDRELVGW